MNGVFGYKILSDYRLIILIYYGSINPEDIKKGMKKLTSDPEFSPKFNIITDFSDCVLNIHPDKIPNYVNYIRYELKAIDSRMSALLTSKPNEVVLTMIYSSLLKDSSIHPEVFSTIEAALSFLSIKSSSLNHVKQQFQNFKKELIRSKSSEI